MKKALEEQLKRMRAETCPRSDRVYRVLQTGTETDGEWREEAKRRQTKGGGERGEIKNSIMDKA